MKTSLPRRVLLFVPLACAMLYGCPQEETTEGDEYADVIYGGGATDEAMVALGSALDQKAPIEDAARAPVLDTPVETELPKGTIVDFTWHFGNVASRLAPVRSPAPETQDESLAKSFALLGPEPQRASNWGALGELFGPIRSAHAHGDPLNGTATFLVFSTANDANLVRVFTDQTTFTPGQETWDKLAAAGSEITLTLIAADFEENRIADGGDPVIGTKFAFSIVP